MSEKTIVKEELLEERAFVVELSGLIDNKLLNTNLEQANFLEIETQKPVLQIGNLLFQGTFEPFLGTAVCFQRQTDSNQAATTNPADIAANSQLTGPDFLSTSDLKLKMKRVYLDKKKSDAEDEHQE